MSALRTHYVEISQHTDNSDGSLSVTAIARRSGIMRYRSDSGDRLEFVPPELIDARDDQGRPVMGMLAGAPNTNEHPAQIIRYSTDSRKAVQVGKVNEEIHIFNDADGERSVKVRFDVSDPETIADIRSGRKKGVSLGYLCNVIKEDGEYKGQTYTHKQAMPFTIDHLAIVANPRNPGALITRFDSDDVAVISMDTARSPIEVIRVDGCCAACSAKSDDDEDEEQETKKKKVKTDAEDVSMIPVTFHHSTIPVSTSDLQIMIEGGIVQPVRFDDRDFFVSMDIALDLHNDAFLGGACGPGWEGTRGNCQRKKRNIGAIARKVGAAALVGGAAVYLGNKIAKNPKKAAAVGAAAVGAGVLFRRIANERAAKAKEKSLKLMHQNIQKNRDKSIEAMGQNIQKNKDKSIEAMGQNIKRNRLSGTAQARREKKRSPRVTADSTESDRNDAFPNRLKTTQTGGRCGRGWIGVKGRCRRGTLAKEDQEKAVRLTRKKATKTDETRKRRLSSETMSDLAGKKEDYGLNRGNDQHDRITSKLNPKEKASSYLEQTMTWGSIKGIAKASGMSESQAKKWVDDGISSGHLREGKGDRAKPYEEVTITQEKADLMKSRGYPIKAGTTRVPLSNFKGEYALNEKGSKQIQKRYKEVKAKDNLEQAPIRARERMRLQAINASQDRIRKEKSQAKKDSIHNDGPIVGGRCGPGWEGSKGNCSRTKRSSGQFAKTVGKAVLIAGAAGAAAYAGSRIAKNPKKAAAIGAAAIGVGLLARRSIRSMKARKAPSHRQLDLFG